MKKQKQKTKFRDWFVVLGHMKVKSIIYLYFQPRLELQ